MAKLKKQTQSQIDGVAYRRSPTWQIALAMLNNGSSMAFYVLVGLMSYVANQGYGIALAVAGGLLTGTRIFDGLIDPILAVIMDKFNTRFGKLRILLGIGFIIRSLAIFSLFIWFADKGHGVVWFVITYMLYIVGSSTCDIAGNMVGPIMSNDPKQRPLIGVWGTVYSYLFPMIFSLISTMVILPKYNNQYTVPMMAEVCIINVAASLVLLLLACIGLTPVDKPENFKGISAAGKEDSVTFKDMLAFLKGNKAFRLYLVQGVSEKLAQQTGSQAIVTTLFYGILIGNMQFGSILQIVSMLPAIVFAIIGARFAGKHGNKESAVIWMRVSIVLAALNILFCAFTDMSKIPSTMLLLVPFFILQLILNGSKMCITTSSTRMSSTRQKNIPAYTRASKRSGILSCLPKSSLHRSEVFSP